MYKKIPQNCSIWCSLLRWVLFLSGRVVVVMFVLSSMEWKGCWMKGFGYVGGLVVDLCHIFFVYVKI